MTLPRQWPALVAGAVGATFFTWMATPRVIDPTEVGWVMHGDWQWHFLGWHLFRHQSWTLPPGAITSYVEPIGSALGYTDSIPLAAFLLKPVASWLPNPFQYLGLWFLVCFTLQGFVGALAVSTWTRSPLLRIAGGSLLVFMPTLLGRMAHPALSSHWLLLWALWLVWRDGPSAEAAHPERPPAMTQSPNRSGVIQHAALGVTSGLVHPYLAVMVLLLLMPLAVSRAIRPRDAASPALDESTRVPRGRFVGAVPFFAAVAGVLAGWWASGLFTVTASGDLQGQYLGNYGMNLLGPLTPVGRSLFLPELPVQAVDQTGEGYQYLGVGVLCLSAIAAALWLRRPRWSAASLPLLLVVCACAVYALSPRVTFGDRVLVDVVDRFDDATIFLVFRASARFFWPVTYAIVVAAVGVVATRLAPRLAVLIVASALVLQVADLHKWYLNVRLGARGGAFYMWDTPLRSAEWHALLSASTSSGARSYEHIRMYSPEFCRGPIPVPFPAVAYLAGLYGLGVNDGFAARVDTARQARECARLRDDFAKGVVDDETIYLIAPALLAEFEQRTGGSTACRQIDGVPVCVTRRSLAGTKS